MILQLQQITIINDFSHHDSISCFYCRKGQQSTRTKKFMLRVPTLPAQFRHPDAIVLLGQHSMFRSKAEPSNTSPTNQPALTIGTIRFTNDPLSKNDHHKWQPGQATIVIWLNQYHHQVVLTILSRDPMIINQAFGSTAPLNGKATPPFTSVEPWSVHTVANPRRVAWMAPHISHPGLTSSSQWLAVCHSVNVLSPPHGESPYSPRIRLYDSNV